MATWVFRLYIYYFDDFKTCCQDNTQKHDKTELFDITDGLKQLLIQCIAEIRAWMLMHQLKLYLSSPHNLRGYGRPSLKLHGLTLKYRDTARNLLDYHFDITPHLQRLHSSHSVLSVTTARSLAYSYLTNCS